MKIRFVGHAGIFVQCQHQTILCDPWLFSLIITHIFWGDSKNVGRRPVHIVEVVHKLCNVNPLHRRSKKDVGNDKALQ